MNREKLLLEFIYFCCDSARCGMCLEEFCGNEEDIIDEFLSSSAYKDSEDLEAILKETYHKPYNILEIQMMPILTTLPPPQESNHG